MCEIYLGPDEQRFSVGSRLIGNLESEKDDRF
jgi:hypothetical protein